MRSIALEFKWAIYFTLMMLAWVLTEKFLGFYSTRIAQHNTVTFFVAIPSILLYVLEMRNKREDYYGGPMTYLQGLRSGVVMTLFVAILTPLSQYLIHNYLSPEFFSNMIDYNVSSGKMKLAEAEAYFNLDNFMLESTIFSAVVGIVTAAIVAIFMRRKVVSVS